MYDVPQQKAQRGGSFVSWVLPMEGARNCKWARICDDMWASWDSGGGEKVGLHRNVTDDTQNTETSLSASSQPPLNKALTCLVASSCSLSRLFCSPSPLCSVEEELQSSVRKCWECPGARPTMWLETEVCP